MRQNVELEIFGVDQSFRYQSAKRMLVDVLDKSGVDYSLADVGDIEKFIEIGLDAVPSIRVNRKKLFSIDPGSDLEEVIGSIFDYISLRTMQNIVVPVDFSECSRNAAEYARRMSIESGFTLELLHVHHPVVDPHNAVILDPDLGTQLRDQLENWRHEFEMASKNGITRHVLAQFEVGYPVQTIIESADREDVELIVMGTLGANDVVDKLLGSNSSSVAAKSKKPVLLVPPGTEFKRFKHIVVAFDKDALDISILDQLIDLNKPYHAHMDFVHVHEGESDDFASMRDELMRKVFVHGNPTFSFDIHEIAATGEGIPEDIEKYCDENKPDLLVVTAQKRAFFERIFHSSVSKKLCLHPHGPVLVLHRRKAT